jgi:hypothetical protein
MDADTEDSDDERIAEATTGGREPRRIMGRAE